MTRIARVRMSRGMTRAQVCDAADISSGHYCYIEQGRHKPTRATAERIAAVLGSTADDLFPKGFSRRYTQRPFGRGIAPRADMQEPLPAAPPRLYPREFDAPCPHCGARLDFRADDIHPVNDEGDGQCYQCGAIFYQGFVPLAEAANV